jgi:hypothetical protein
MLQAWQVYSQTPLLLMLVSVSDLLMRSVCAVYLVTDLLTVCVTLMLTFGGTLSDDTYEVRVSSCFPEERENVVVPGETLIYVPGGMSDCKTVTFCVCGLMTWSGGDHDLETDDSDCGHQTMVTGLFA